MPQQVCEAEIHDINKLKKKARANAGVQSNNVKGKDKAGAPPQPNYRVGGSFPFAVSLLAAWLCFSPG